MVKFSVWSAEMATSGPAFHFPALTELVGRQTLQLVRRWAQVHLLRRSRNVSWAVVMPLVLHWVEDTAYMRNSTCPQTYRTTLFSRSPAANTVNNSWLLTIWQERAMSSFSALKMAHYCLSWLKVNVPLSKIQEGKKNLLTVFMSFASLQVSSIMSVPHRSAASNGLSRTLQRLVSAVLWERSYKYWIM